MEKREPIQTSLAHFQQLALRWRKYVLSGIKTRPSVRRGIGIFASGRETPTSLFHCLSSESTDQRQSALRELPAERTANIIRPAGGRAARNGIGGA
jgi:hypothetical protein